MNSIDCLNCGKNINTPVIFCPHCDKILPESIQKLLYEKPKLSKKDKAIKAAKTGAIAACIAGILRLPMWFSAIFDAKGMVELLTTIFLREDLVLIFILAYGIYKKSRTAAVVICVYWLFFIILRFIIAGNIAGAGVNLVFLYFFGKAIQGTFTYHKIEKEKKTCI